MTSTEEKVPCPVVLTVVKLPAAGVVAPITVLSILPALISTVARVAVPVAVIPGAHTVSEKVETPVTPRVPDSVVFPVTPSVPPTVALPEASIVVKSAAAGVVAPIVVPSIVPPLMSAVSATRLSMFAVPVM